ncbi:MAG: hypothetical protein V1659_00820 [Candidatus Woesearchaeota archaeon]
MKLLVSKKGSLSLSTEAIVILIMAVVMLGLGLTFVRNVFINMGGDFDEAKVEREPETPTVSDIVTLSKSVVSIPSGKASGIKIGVYNPETTDACVKVELDDTSTDCIGLLKDGINGAEFSPAKIVSSQKSEVFLAVLKGKKTSEELTALCSFKVSYAAAPASLADACDFTTLTALKNEDFSLQVSS